MTTALTLAKLAPLIREAYGRCDFIYAYAIQAGEGGPVKIGVTRDPVQRLKTLQTGNPETLRGLAAWRVLPGEERLIHDDFASVRIRGEWFHPTPELLEYVLWEGGIFCDWGDE